MEPHAFPVRKRTLLLLAFTGALAVASPAAAQPPPPVPPPPAAPPGALPFQMPAAGPDPIAIALAPKSGGLTAEDVAKVVSRTKHSVRSKQEDLKAAAARMDQAMVAYFPKVSVGAS